MSDLSYDFIMLSDLTCGSSILSLNSSGTQVPIVSIHTKNWSGKHPGCFFAGMLESAQMARATKAKKVTIPSIKYKDALIFRTLSLLFTIFPLFGESQFCKSELYEQGSGFPHLRKLCLIRLSNDMRRFSLWQYSLANLHGSPVLLNKY